MNKYTHLPNWKDQEKEWMKVKSFRKSAESAEPEYQLARTLIAKRLKKGFTQVELAKRANTSQSAIARVESGTHTVTLTFLKRIAQALDARIEIALR